MEIIDSSLFHEAQIHNAKSQMPHFLIMINRINSQNLSPLPFSAEYQANFSIPPTHKI